MDLDELLRFAFWLESICLLETDLNNLLVDQRIVKRMIRLMDILAVLESFRLSPDYLTSLIVLIDVKFLVSGACHTFASRGDYFLPLEHP